MNRFVLFFVINIAVILLFSVFMLFIKLPFSSLIHGIVISGIIGFLGSIISLLMSKYIALFSVNGKILKSSKNEMETWLLHIVRNQSLRLGIIAPQVAIYNACDMNAFATGAHRDSALIAVSTGLLKNMNKDEIEAVIAHEMSHIFNGDMVTLTLIQGVINVFVIFISRILAHCVSYCMSLSSFLNSSDDNDNNSDFQENSSSVYFVVSVILELVFGVLANILIFWFSRQREFYADAGSAELVGCNKMIAALEKLKLSSKPKESKVVASFCINGRYGMGNMFNELFMSHPPLKDRIRALRNGYYLNRFSFFVR